MHLEEVWGSSPNKITGANRPSKYEPRTTRQVSNLQPDRHKRFQGNISFHHSGNPQLRLGSLRRLLMCSPLISILLPSEPVK